MSLWQVYAKVEGQWLEQSPPTTKEEAEWIVAEMWKPIHAFRKNKQPKPSYSEPHCVPL